MACVCACVCVCVCVSGGRRREREICIFLSKGYTAKEIGRSLNISPRTAEIHRSRIMEKLTVDSNADLVSLAIAQGMQD